MATVKTNKQTANAKDTNADTFWRKPITLDSFEDEDPLATLYRGRETGDSAKNIDESAQNRRDKTVAKKPKKSEKPVVASGIKPKEIVDKKKLEETAVADKAESEISSSVKSPTISEEELKNILRIKSDSFQFTDIREILRGKSFDIYAYLRFLAGDGEVCKIKHLDLMKKLDISRPTLFKQGDWLARLSLIEKRNVPGDHLGTSYTVRRLEDALPISDSLVAQIDAQIEIFRQS